MKKKTTTEQTKREEIAKQKKTTTLTYTNDYNFLKECKHERTNKQLENTHTHTFTQQAYAEYSPLDHMFIQE